MRNLTYPLDRPGPGYGSLASILLLTIAVILGPLLMSASPAESAARVIALNPDNRVGKMQVVIGNSESLRIDLPFSEIVVGDPETADVNPLTDQTLYVLGRKLGFTNVTLFNAEKQVVAVIDIEVTHNLEGLRQSLRQSLPGSRIKVRSTNGRVLLEGQVPSAPAAEKAVAIARDFAGDQVTNSLSIAANQQVNLEVRFVEVNRSAGKEFGINWNLTSDGNGAGTGTGVAGGSDRPNCLRCVRDGSKETYVGRRTRLYRRHRDRLLVDVQAHENGSLCHDSLPVSGARPCPVQRNPRCASAP